MGIPPSYHIEQLHDPRGPYQYVVWCGWRSASDGYGVLEDWIDYFTEAHGCEGHEFGGPWYHCNLTHKVYFKEKDYPFFIMKFGYIFNRRPWEI